MTAVKLQAASRQQARKALDCSGLEPAHHRENRQFRI